MRNDPDTGKAALASNGEPDDRAAERATSESSPKRRIGTNDANASVAYPTQSVAVLKDCR